METTQHAGNISKENNNKKYFLNSIAGEYKTSVRTFDTREIKRESYRESAYNTTLEKRSNKRTKKKSPPRTESILLNLRIPGKEDYSKPISNSFFINIIV